jgi:predicted Rossmann fold flavoprotein
VIIGAGAAGLMAAITAAGAGGEPPVVLLERTSDGGRKILISGGGRCNVLPSVLAPERFVTDSPAHLLRAMLRSWPLAGQREFFENVLRVPLALERETGKLFPRSNRARDVRDALVARAQALGVRLQFNTLVTRLEPCGHGAWRLETSGGELRASRVVLATGGLSVPATGSDGLGLREAARLGHEVHDTYAALTPLLSEGAPHASLSGVSLPVRLRARWRGRVTQSTGGFLFTHRGYSGPSVLDVSHVVVRSRMNGEHAAIRVQWSPLAADAWHERLTTARGLVANVIGRELPARLASMLLAECGIPADRTTRDLRRHERTALVERLTSYELPWTGDEGFKKAEVTGGGVALTEVNPRTLESRRYPNLFFCGEMLDAFGPIGGHNFAWAWATGRLAGLGVCATAEPRARGTPHRI